MRKKGGNFQLTQFDFLSIKKKIPFLLEPIENGGQIRLAEKRTRTNEYVRDKMRVSHFQLKKLPYTRT